MNCDEHLLTGAQECFSIDMLLKATPAQEGGRRFIYLEASNEARDLQNDVVLARALEDSTEHFLTYGNIDIDHKSMDAVAVMHKIPDPHMWAVGSPVEVRVRGGSTFVKAELLSGDTPLADRANMVWDSMTKLNPPRKWFPSVGGKILHKSTRIDDQTGDKYGVVSSVRWTNIALSQHPVNNQIPGIRTIPFDVLAKSMTATGACGLVKALEASYATDAASKTGGAALGMQSLDTGSHRGTPRSYFEFRKRLTEDLQSGFCAHGSPDGLVAYSAGNFALSHDEAAEWVDRYLSDLKSGLKLNGVRK